MVGLLYVSSCLAKTSKINGFAYVHVFTEHTGLDSRCQAAVAVLLCFSYYEAKIDIVYSESLSGIGNKISANKMSSFVGNTFSWCP